MESVPHLVEMQKKWKTKGLSVVGVTDGSKEAAQAFAKEYGASYPIRANGAEIRDSYGVSMVWGTVMFLVNPDGDVVSDEFDDFEAILEDKLSQAKP